MRRLAIAGIARYRCVASCLTCPASVAWVRSVSRVTAPKVPPAPPLSAQNRSGLLAALAVRTAPSGVTTSASSRFAAAVRGLRRPGAQTVVELHGPHVGPGPDEQRIRRVRARDITVTAALHHQADTVLAGEVHRGRDIGAAVGEHRVRAGPRGPGIGPAEGLGQDGTVPDVEGIAQVLEQIGARGAARVGRPRGKRRLHRHQAPAHARAELRPLRRAGPARLAGPDTPGLLHSATRGGSKTGHKRQPPATPAAPSGTRACALPSLFPAGQPSPEWRSTRVHRRSPARRTPPTGWGTALHPRHRVAPGPAKRGFTACSATVTCPPACRHRTWHGRGRSTPRSSAWNRSRSGPAGCATSAAAGASRCSSRRAWRQAPIPRWRGRSMTSWPWLPSCGTAGWCSRRSTFPASSRWTASPRWRATTRRLALVNAPPGSGTARGTSWASASPSASDRTRPADVGAGSGAPAIGMTWQLPDTLRVHLG